MTSTLKVDTIQGKTTAGTVAMPSGTPVQLQTTQSNFSYQEVATTSYVEVTNMNVTITPKFASSKIKISSQVSWWLTTDANNYMFLTYYRDIGGGGYSNLADDTTYDAMQFYAPSKNATLNNCAILNFIDTPNTTSAVTYKLYCRKYDGTNHVRLKYAQTSSLMTVEEIKQ
jgi:hypothetical protein